MNKILLGLSVATTLLLAACSSTKTTENGLEYEIFTKNEGEKIKLNDYVRFDMKYYNDKDSLIFDSKTQKRPVELVCSAPYFKADLNEALMLLTNGDSAMFKIAADSLFKGQPYPPNIDSGSMITFYVKVLEVKTKKAKMDELDAERAKMADKEKATIAAYAKANNLTTITTASGLQYVITQEGKGDKPMAGDMIKVHYTGTLFTGKKFDSSFDLGKPIEFPVGRGQVIRGWDEAFLLFNKGTKATILIPAALAYGEQGAGDVIPPFAQLRFEVELLDIVKAK